jgi:ketosteroid isomerase-like protein
VSSIGEEIAALEHAVMEAWCRKDRPALERLLGEDFELSSALGRRMTRAPWLEAVMDRLHVNWFRFESLEASPVNAAGDVVVAHAKVNQRATAEGREWHGTFLVTDVWVRREGTWQLVARHGSALPGHAP